MRAIITNRIAKLTCKRSSTVLSKFLFSTWTHEIDIRSDTVTKPSRAMMEAALEAPVGDDVMSEDPTVLELQDYMADLCGFEAGLFVPTGTMANLVSVMAHCHGRASEMIVGSQSHISLWEGGNTAGLAGVHSKLVVEDEFTGKISQCDVRDAFRSDDDDHYAKTEVLCLENTQNWVGGVALDASYTQEMAALTKELGIGLHIDGARICNAAVALNVPLRELCAPANTVSICLSKGLGAPLGSVVVGSKDLIRLAKRARKRCGGGMRQAGVVAAMGLYAIQNNYERLALDHARAERLGGELKRNGFRVARQGKVDSNIVYFALPEDSAIAKEDYCGRLYAEHGVKLSGGYNKGGELFRAVTHLDLTDEDIDMAAECLVKAAF